MLAASNSMPSTQAEQILDAIAAVDQALVQTSDLAFMLREVWRNLLDIFSCERAYLHLLEGVEGGGLFEPIVLSRLPEGEVRWQVLEDDDFGRSLLATARVSEVVRCGTGGPAIPAGSRLSALGVRSAMVGVFTPRLGPAFVVGIHDCARGREWDLERRLLASIGRRVADVLAHVVAVDHLHKCEARSRVLIEHAGDPIMLIDVGTQRIIDTNQKAEQLLGWPHGHLIGVEISQLSPEFQPDEVRSEERMTELLAEVAAGTIRRVDWNYRRAGGDVLTCEVELVLVPDAERLLVRARVTGGAVAASRS
jgi:PAS domain S-box-containing protein